jgi:hypothetical protein
VLDDGQKGEAAMASTQTGRYSGKLTGGKPPLPEGTQNGRIPLSSLGRCVTQTRAEHPFLYAPAARAFDAITEAAARDNVIIEAVALYRDFDGQVKMKEFWTAKGKPGNAATPGRSNHGWGTAADVNRHQPGVLDWLAQKGPTYGWDHPLWAGSAQGPQFGREPWHWQFIVGFRMPEEIPIFVNGTLVPEADAVMEGGRVMLALRPVANALSAQITGFKEGQAFVDGGAMEGWVPMEIRAGRGFVPARDLANVLGKTIDFDEATRQVRIG